MCAASESGCRATTAVTRLTREAILIARRSANRPVDASMFGFMQAATATVTCHGEPGDHPCGVAFEIAGSTSLGRGNG